MIKERKNKKQQQKVCECGWCNSGPQAWTKGTNRKPWAVYQVAPLARTKSGRSTFNVFPSFSPEGKTSTTKSLSLFNAGQTVKSSGRSSKLPDCIWWRLSPLKTAVCILRFRGEGRKCPQVTSMSPLLQDKRRTLSDTETLRGSCWTAMTNKKINTSIICGARR